MKKSHLVFISVFVVLASSMFFTPGGFSTDPLYIAGWVTMAFATTSIGYGVFLLIQRLRKKTIER